MLSLPYILFKWRCYHKHDVVVDGSYQQDSSLDITPQWHSVVHHLWVTVTTGAVASLGGWAGWGGLPRVTPSMGWHPNESNFFSWIYKEHLTKDKRSLGRWRGGSGDNDQKRSSLILRKKGWHHQLPRRVTPTLVTPLHLGIRPMVQSASRAN